MRRWGYILPVDMIVIDPDQHQTSERCLAAAVETQRFLN
jgi:hypothetical protein